MKRVLAKITSANLAIQERGILNFWINVDYEEGMSQGIGGITLDEWSDDLNSRVGTSYGCEMIRRILLELCVDDFSQMKGKKIWVFGDGESLSFNPKGISSLRVDNKKSEPVIFDEIANEFIKQNINQ